MILGNDQAAHDYIYWEIHHPFQQALRKGKWKGFRLGTQEPLELYDLENDPGESRDISEDHPEVVEMMERILATARTESRYFATVEKRQTKKQRSKNK